MKRKELSFSSTSLATQHIAIYIRVSTNHQIDRDSLPLQRTELINYAKYALGIEKYEVFEDAGFSAKNTVRPQYQEMIKKIRNGDFTHILVWKIDRISRNLLDFASMYEEFKRLNITFISKNEQFDTSTAMGEAMLKIILIFAELERQMTSERVTAVMQSRATNGKWNGGRIPYGYDYNYETTEFSINPNEHKVALLMCDLYETSKSLLYTSRHLNKLEYQTRAGNSWTPVQVRKILTNPFNIGQYVYNQTSINIKGVQLPNSKEDHIVFENHHPALFNKERQDKIIAQLKRNTRSKATVSSSINSKNTHVFSGLLFCENCGKMLTSSTGKELAGDGWRPSIYLCPSKRRHTSNKCHNTTDSSIGEFVINFVMNMLNAQRNFVLIHNPSDLQKMLLYGKVFDDIVLDQDSLSDMYNILSSNIPSRTNAGLKKTIKKAKINPEITRLNKELTKHERALERLKHLYMYSESPIGKNEFLTEHTKISDAYSETKARLDELHNYEPLERSISDTEFIQQTTAFILAKKLSGNSYINYRKLAGNTDTQILKSFFNSILDSITLNENGNVGSIVFKNGLRHQFIYNSKNDNIK